MPPARAVLRNAVPLSLVALVASGRSSARVRGGALAALVALWSAVYARYRRVSLTETARERALLARIDWPTFRRHYDERVPTIEEEFELWGPYHQHRHEMRYDLVARAVRQHLRAAGGVVVDVGCGSALVADRLADLDAHYVGTDLGEHQVGYGARRPSDAGRLRRSFVRSTAEALPLPDASVDVVVMSEVIEHLLRPEVAVWEVARVLRPGGAFVMTTNNACEAPLRSPLSHMLVWVERIVGFRRPQLLSRRPWVWPERVAPELTPPGSPDVYLPHTHHIAAETESLFAAAGLVPVATSTFEFPPPQSATAAWLERHGRRGRQAVDVVEWVCRRTPGIRRLGCHLMIVARRSPDPVPPVPAPGLWPGPFSP